MVFEYRLVQFDWFLEEMSIAQAYMCMDNIKWTDLTLKTLTRYQIWSLYNSNGWYKNKNEITDIMPLPWDEDDIKHRVATDSELEEQKSYLKQMEDMMKSTTIEEEKFI